MDYCTQLAILLALVSISSATETIVTSFAEGESPLKLNRDEDISIKCVIKTNEPLLLTHVTKWYKEQTPNDWIIVGEGKEETAPFNNANKYEIDYKIVSAGGDNNELLYTLNIKGVDRNDAGNYRCGSGQSADQLQMSNNSVELMITPDDSNPSLSTTALKENDVYKFNLTNKVSCEAAAPSSSGDLKLVMSVNGMDVGPEYEGVNLVEWEGSTEGLKVPTTRLSMTNMEWQPSDYGRFTVRCQFQDGERILGGNEFTAVREEPLPEVKIECYSNYGTKRVKTDDTQLAIICIPKNTDRIKNMYVEFAFFNRDERVVLKEGESNHGRLVKSDLKNNERRYILDIPRAIREVVTVGQNIYNVSIYGEGSEDTPAAFTEFILPVDSTEKYSSAQTTMPVATLLLLALMTSLL